MSNRIELTSTTVKWWKGVKGIAEERRRALTLKPTRLAIAVCLVILSVLSAFIMQGNSGTQSQTLYAHAETTTIGGVSYYLHKLSPADGNGTTLSASAVTTGRKLMGRWVYPLTGIISIPASTWTVTYRAMKSASASSVVAHGDIDILIRKSDNTIRTTIASNVANSPTITLVNSWQTLSGTYGWTAYTVVDQADYLEVAYYIEVTTPQSSKSVRLMVDNGTLPLADQTKVTDVVFAYPNQAPVASFTFSPSNPLIYDTVTFNASASYDSDGSIVSYRWDFGDGNITTVTSPIITHFYTTAYSTVNYTVTLTVTDNEGSTGFTTQIVPVTNPAILHISLPAGTYVGPDPDDWLSQCWLLNNTGLSGTFTVRINNTHASYVSYDTHLIIALNNASYQYLSSLSVNTTTIPKASFTYGKPEPYGYTLTWENDVYPTWFSDTYVVGDINPKSYRDVTVSVAFSNATGLRMHFDAYGSADATLPPSKGHVTDNPHQKDSTVLFSAAPVVQYYLTVKTEPLGVTFISGEGWYSDSTNVTLTAPTPVSNITGVRYRFSYWDVDSISQGIGVNPITVHMNANHTAIAHYIKQYYLTLTTNPLGVTTPTGADWYDAGTYASISTSQYVDIVLGSSRYRFNGWTTADMSEITNASATSTTVLMDKAKTVTANYIIQYLVTFNQTGVGSDFTGTVVTIDGTNYSRSALPLSATFWWDANSVHNFTYQSPLVVTPNTKRYVWNSTSGLSTVQSGSITVTMSGSVVGNYKTQYYLTVISPYGTPSGAGWYYEGDTAYADLDVGMVDHGNGTRRVFKNWSGDASGTNYVQSDPILMNGPKTAVAVWKTQYRLIVRTSGLGTLVTNVYNGTTVLGTATDATPYSNWFDQGSLISLNIDSPIIDGSNQFNFTQWTGDATGTTRPVSVTMNTAKDITANYKTQYQITVTASPGGAIGGTFKVTYTQCGTTYTNVQKTTTWTEWVDSGTTVTVSDPQDIINVSSDTRYKFDSYNPSASVTMSQSKTITLVYKTQYRLIVRTNGLGTHVTNVYNGTTVLGTATDSSPYINWFDMSGALQLNVDSPIIDGSTQFVFTQWTGDATGTTRPVSVTMNSGKDITANYKTQYYLTVISPYGTTSGAGWYDNSTTAYAGLNTGVVEDAYRTRRVFTHWSGDASGTNYTQSNPIHMNGPKTAIANWKTQYLLAVRTERPGLIPQPTRNVSGDSDSPLNRGWWYDASTHVRLTAPSVSYWNTAAYDFQNWNIDGNNVTGNPYTVHMNQPRAAIAYYKPQGPVGGVSVPINRSVSTNTFNPATNWIIFAFIIIHITIGTRIIAKHKKKRK